MFNDINADFSGSFKSDTTELFVALNHAAVSSSAISFFQIKKSLAKQLAKLYKQATVQKMMIAAFSFIDKDGNSILSTAYENENADTVNIATSFILENGADEASVYKPLCSARLIMIYRKVGIIGDFNKNLLSIYSQQMNLQNTEEYEKLIMAFPFISTPREIVITTTSETTKAKEKSAPIFTAQNIRFTQKAQNIFYDFAKIFSCS